VRGIFGGNGDLTMDARADVNCAVEPFFAVSQSASHTLQTRDREHSQALRARLIEATVDATVEGSGPRLGGSRL
jgi:hypothetical protein